MSHDDTRIQLRFDRPLRDGRSEVTIPAAHHGREEVRAQARMEAAEWYPPPTEIAIQRWDKLEGWADVEELNDGEWE